MERWNWNNLRTVRCRVQAVITMDEYWLGRDTLYAAEWDQDIQKNGAVTVLRANELLRIYRTATRSTEEHQVTSGWRPAIINMSTRGAAPRSKHLTAQAVDLADIEGTLDDWCLKNPQVLASIGLWQEHPASTKSWIHIQIVPPKSGNRVFYP